GSSNEIVFVHVGSRGISRCFPAGARSEQLAAFNENEVADGAQMLPGGKALLFTLAKVADGPTRWDKANIMVETMASHERKTIISGGSSIRFLESGHLLYAVGGTVFAVAFDPVRLTVLGEPAPVIDGVRRSPALSTVYLDVSRDGTLVYMP